jgi:hypothetical protein
MSGHPSAVPLPAILAEAENLGSDGREMVTACVAGYECRQWRRGRNYDDKGSKSGNRRAAPEYRMTSAASGHARGPGTRRTRLAGPRSHHRPPPTQGRCRRDGGKTAAGPGPACRRTVPGPGRPAPADIVPAAGRLRGENISVMGLRSSDYLGCEPRLVRPIMRQVRTSGEL